MSRKNTTRFAPNPKHPPKLSKADAKRLDAMTDDDIDYRDIPGFAEDFWRTARILKPSPRRMISLRVDEEVLDWFRANSRHGRGYQTYMNAILRAFVETQRMPTLPKR